MSIDFRDVSLESLIDQRDSYQFHVCHLNSALFRSLRDALKKVSADKDFKSWVTSFKEAFPKYCEEFWDTHTVDELELAQKRDLLLNFLHEKNTKNRKILLLIRQQA